MMEKTTHNPHNPPDNSGSTRRVLVAILLVMAIYGVAAAFGLPQHGTELILAAEQGDHPAAEAPEHIPPPLAMLAPFALLLGTIAVFPLLPRVAHWWESNLHKFYAAAILAAATLVYFLLWHEYPLAAHWPAHHLVEPNPNGPNLQMAWGVFAGAIFREYLPFMTLLFSLYTVCGGIRIEGDLTARPITNTLFLLVGGLLASFIGTTGAAMLLIRPLLHTNRERNHVVHTLVFFIFIVCNCGGCLLPIGDPPLFLGYLLGVPFLYTFDLWKEWLFVNGLLLVIYFVWDTAWFHPREKKIDLGSDEVRVHRLRFAGLWPNIPLLLLIVFSVAALSPGKPFLATGWYPWMYLREVVQLALVGLSLFFGDEHLRRHNHFNYFAILEVAVLFFGIFITMQPALQILDVWGPNLGLTTPTHFFWATGGLSSFLDNAPTYVVFFTAAKALTHAGGLADPVAGVSRALLAAVSLGAVFMGANTYIGNGPNFMVKAIAEQSGVKMPSFFGYMLYSMCILIPIFILTDWLFL
jgi:Na+/H+ antiporter NhaD/arsenite permease-like protein